MVSRKGKHLNKKQNVSSEGNTSDRNGGRLKVTLICAGVIIAVLVGVYVYAIFFYDSVYPNVFMNGTSLSGLSQTAAEELIKSDTHSLYEDKTLELARIDDSCYINSTDIEAGFDYRKAAENAYLFGRQGNLLNRMVQISSSLFFKTEIENAFIYNEQKLRDIIVSEVSKINREKSEYAYLVADNYLHIKTAVTGVYIDENDLYEKVLARFRSADFSVLEFKVDSEEPVPIDLKSIYDSIYKEPRDARLEKQDDGEYIIVPHMMGVAFDMAATQNLLDTAQSEEIKVPLVSVSPQITSEQLEQTLFKDVLVEKSTKLTNPGLISRTSNVQLAASFVDGIILGPGDEFSYNDAVGERTVARGFREAKIFSRGEIVDGVGGGICQVSSTIYMAAVYADLEITNRVNHSFTVDYTKLGEDATVYWGSIDFKFKNNTPYPIKIDCKLVNNSVVVILYGTKTSENTTELESIVTRHIPYERIEREDASIEPGNRKVDVVGHSGYTVETYRVIKDAEGNVVKKTFEAKSIYKKLDEVVLISPAVPVINPENPEGLENPQVPEEPGSPEGIFPGETESQENPVDDGQMPNFQGDEDDDTDMI